MCQLSQRITLEWRIRKQTHWFSRQTISQNITTYEMVYIREFHNFLDYHEPRNYKYLLHSEKTLVIHICEVLLAEVLAVLGSCYDKFFSIIRG